MYRSKKLWYATIVAAALVLMASACSPDTDSRVSGLEPGHFVENSSAYTIGAVVAQVPSNDDVTLFGVGHAVRTKQGYLLADAGNDRLALFDYDLNLLGTTGRQGDGPGEYQFIWKLAPADDRIVVLDVGKSDASYVGPGGAFVERTVLRASPNDVAWHPELGLLVVDSGSPDHYLSRFDGSGQVPLAQIPSAFRADAAVGQIVFSMRTDLVAVTPEGMIHVFDGTHLALVTYAPDGTSIHANFLPEPARSEELRQDAERREAFGGPSVVLPSEMATSLQPLADGRLFVGVSMGEATGYVLAPGTAEATPVVFAEGHEGTTWGARAYFDDERILLYGISSWGPQVALAEVELVER